MSAIGIFNFKEADVARLKSLFPDNHALRRHLDNRDFSAVSEVNKYIRELGDMTIRMSSDVTFIFNINDRPST